MCVGFFLWRRSCVFFLSSCSVWGRLLLGLLWCGFCASSGAPAVFRGVSCRWLPLAGSATFLAPVSWPTPAVETCCWVGGVFGAPLGFLPCVVLFLRGLRFVQLPLPQLTLGGVFCLFCHRVPYLLLLWWRGLGGNPSLIFLCFSCAGWLAGVCWVLHPVSGSSRWGCVCSLGDSVMTLLAFPYLRVGALLAWGVFLQKAGLSPP